MFLLLQYKEYSFLVKFGSSSLCILFSWQMCGIYYQNFLWDIRISWEPGSLVPRDYPTLDNRLSTVSTVYHTLEANARLDNADHEHTTDGKIEHLQRYLSTLDRRQGQDKDKIRTSLYENKWIFLSGTYDRVPLTKERNMGLPIVIIVPGIIRGNLDVKIAVQYLMSANLGSC